MVAHRRHKMLWLAAAILWATALALIAGPTTPALADYESEEGHVIVITASQFAFTPSVITLTTGERYILEISTSDVLHGFNCPELGIRADVRPGEPARIIYDATRAGEFVFYCDVFCGEGHAKMTGTIVIEEAVPYRQ